MAKRKIKVTKTKAKAKAAPTEHATPTSRKVYSTDAEKITCTGDHLSAMQASPSWATAADVQTSANAWSATAAALGTNGKLIDSLQEQLAAAVSGQRVLRIKWLAGRKHVLSAVGVFCAGSTALIQGLGFDVLSHLVGDILVPASIVTTPGVAVGEVDTSWDDSVNRHGFMVQHASDPTNAATYSAFIPCTVGTYTLTGQASSATVYFRVAAVDPSQPTHLTAWSAWVAGTAR